MVVRAFDLAENWRDEKKRIEIVSPAISFIGDKGFTVRGFLIAWPFLITLLLVILFLVALLIFLNKKKDRETKRKVREGIDNMRGIIDNEILLLKRKLTEDGLEREKVIEQLEALERLKQKTEEKNKL